MKINWNEIKERNYFTWFDLSPQKYNETDSDNSFNITYLPFISISSNEFEFDIGIGFAFYSLYFTHKFK
jgi:hypothetical protein